MEAASIIAMIGGAYMQNEAANDAADRQQQLISNAAEEQDKLSRKAEGTALENAEEYNPQTRLARFMDARQSAGDSLVSDLTTAREQQGLSGGKSEQATGRLSQDFLTGKAAAAADEYQKSVDMARLMGNMRGAGDMLTAEGLTNADYALKGGMIGSQARRSLGAAQPGIASAGTPDGSAMMIGGLAQGLGSAGMTMGAKSGTLTGAGTTAPKSRLGSGMYGIMGG